MKIIYAALLVAAALQGCALEPSKPRLATYPLVHDKYTNLRLVGAGWQEADAHECGYSNGVVYFYPVRENCPVAVDAYPAGTEFKPVSAFSWK
jgi:hypothetical protein